MSSSEVIVIDTSPFYRFCDAGIPLELKSCVPGAVITPEVELELGRSGNRAVRIFAKSTTWPRRRILNDENRSQALDMVKVWMQPGDPPDKNLGEISSVLLARQIGAALLIMDDALGIKLARFRGISTLSTADLAASAAIAETLSEEHARRVFDVASPSHCGDKEWIEALERARQR